MSEESNNPSKPFKVTDWERQSRKGLVAGSLADLNAKIIEKFDIGTEPLKIVLECDGTEIDDEEYFGTLEPDTCLMALAGEQKWQPSAPHFANLTDQVDGDSSRDLAGLVGKLKHNLCHVSLLGGPELELLSDMDPESLADITFPDKIFLEQLKEASSRFLNDKRQAQDAIELLKLYQEQDVRDGDVSPLLNNTTENHVDNSCNE